MGIRSAAEVDKYEKDLVAISFPLGQIYADINKRIAFVARTPGDVIKKLGLPVLFDV